MSPSSPQHVILDRDGVLNRELASGWISSPSQWQWEKGSLEALRQLTRAGVEISIVSNQSGIGRGVISREAVDDLHRWLETELAAQGVTLAGIYICPHAPEEGCDCRKPQPGLVLRALGRSRVPAERSILIGDDLRDLEAAQTAGVPAVLVRTGKGDRVRDRVEPDTLVFENLLEAVSSLIETRTGEAGATRTG